MMLEHEQREELINTISHAIGLALSLIGTIFLVAYAIKMGDPWRITSFGIYSLSLIVLYLASTVYHGSKHPDRKELFKTFDHCAIYLLIAGTYTPFLLITLRDGSGLGLMWAVWGIAVAGISLKLLSPERFHGLRVASYLVMGWLIVLSGGELFSSLDTGGLVLLVTGGVIYSLGIIFYLGERIPFNHAIWHGFVLGGSTCHFMAVYFYV